MTLSLDEVRNIRFPMARKPNEDGYRASAVDNFMDKLEISYAQLVEEIDQLRCRCLWQLWGVRRAAWSS